MTQKMPNLPAVRNADGAFRKPPVEFTDERKQRYIDVISKVGLKYIAAEAAGVTQATVTGHLREDPEFREAVEHRLQEFHDRMEREMYRRGVQGVLEPVFYQGRVVGTIRRYDSNLLVRLMEANRPEKFGRKAEVDVNHKGGVLVIPSGAQSAEAWLAEHGAAASLEKPAISVEAQTVEEEEDNDNSHV